MIARVLILLILLGALFLVLRTAFRFVLSLLFIVITWKRYPLPYVPTDLITRFLLRWHPALPKKARLVIDLGMGTGDMLYSVYKRYRQAEVHGVEIQSELVRLSKWLFFPLPKERLHLSAGDMFEYPVDQADLIIGFWTNAVIPDLMKKFEAECAPECMIVTSQFPLPESEIFEHVRTVQVLTAKLFFYKRRSEM